MLFLSELETGREVVALGEVGVREVLDEVAGRAGRARACAPTSRSTSRAIPRSLLPMRPRMLRVVVENLAENALRYAGPARDADAVDRPRGRRRRAHARATPASGVAEQDLPRLFERFYRADRARASRGTGLGLAIVKHIVTAAGGEVEATSAPGRGLRDPLRLRLAA